MEIKEKLNKKETFIFILLLLPNLSILGVRLIFPETVIEYWRIAALGYLAFMMLRRHSQIKLTFAFGLFAACQAVIFISTLIHHGFSSGILFTIGFHVLVFLYIQNLNYREIVSALCSIIIVSTLINVPAMLMRTGNQYAMYFLGGKNALSMILVPGMFLTFLNALNKYDKVSKRSIITAGFYLFCIFVGSSGTGMVVAVTAAVLALLALRYKPQKWTYITIIAICYAMLIIFSDDFLASDYWSQFTDMLGKDSTLTARADIWEKVKNVVGENAWIGTGRGTEITIQNQWTVHHTFTEAHNFILEIMMQGGTVALVLYLGAILNAVLGLDMSIMRHRMAFLALCMALVNGLTESTVNGLIVTITLGIACRFANEKNEARKTENELQPRLQSL